MNFCAQRSQVDARPAARRIEQAAAWCKKATKRVAGRERATAHLCVAADALEAAANQEGRPGVGRV